MHFHLIAAEELGIKELIPAYLDPSLKVQDLQTGVSFASGGCGYDPQTPQIAVQLDFILKVEWNISNYYKISHTIIDAV